MAPSYSIGNYSKETVSCESGPGGGQVRHYTMTAGAMRGNKEKLKLEHDITMSAVFDSVVTNDGFVFQQLDSRRASLDLAECVVLYAHSLGLRLGLCVCPSLWVCDCVCVCACLSLFGLCFCVCVRAHQLT